MAIERKYIVLIHVMVTASIANSRRIVGMAIFIEAERNGVIKAVAVEITSTRFLLAAVPESLVISIFAPFQAEDSIPCLLEIQVKQARN
jgi:hypothetical protein